MHEVPDVVQDSVEEDMVNVAHGLRTQKLCEADADSFIARCQRECWCALPASCRLPQCPPRCGLCPKFHHLPMYCTLSPVGISDANCGTITSPIQLIFHHTSDKIHI